MGGWEVGWTERPGFRTAGAAGNAAPSAWAGWHSELRVPRCSGSPGVCAPPACLPVAMHARRWWSWREARARGCCGRRQRCCGAALTTALYRCMAWRCRWVGGREVGATVPVPRHCPTSCIIHPLPLACRCRAGPPPAHRYRWPDIQPCLCRLLPSATTLPLSYSGNLLARSQSALMP